MRVVPCFNTSVQEYEIWHLETLLCCMVQNLFRYLELCIMVHECDRQRTAFSISMLKQC